MTIAPFHGTELDFVPNRPQILCMLPILPPVEPHVIIAASVGLPDLVSGHAEIFVADQWAVEVGAGGGLLPLSLHAGVRWTPLCWGCWEGHAFRLAPGALVFVFPTDLAEGMGVVDLDASWVWYQGNGLGLTAGARAGAGLAWGRTSAGIKLEPALEVVPFQVGLVF